ncbi:MAG TPA: 3-hydroxyacyl-CoA dehydrogenase family protein [Bacillus sp. (in: firmicutes)]|nr:3-hydroxyacyl-CoA dehydrogenase family protein [Bacillus sp. (in: firmicutes)]
MKRIAVLGAGVMGHGIAQIYAQEGYDVRLYDVAKQGQEKAKELIENSMDLFVKEKLIAREKKEQAIQNLIYTTNLAEAVTDVGMVIEVVPEVIELKWDIFRQIEEIVGKEVIIASNTSAFPLSTLRQQSQHPERFIITHFFNPAQLVPLVEIIQDEKTAPKVVETTKQYIESIQKSPIVLQKEVPGFVANRLQAAVAREVYWLLENGVASPEDIDIAMRDGLGFRWAFIGPLKTNDFGGLDTLKRVFDHLFPLLSNADSTPEFLGKLVKEGKLGVKTGEGFYSYDNQSVQEQIQERDENFIRLLKQRNQ